MTGLAILQAILEIIINWNHYDNFAHMIMAQEPSLKSKIVECDEKDLPF